MSPRTPREPITSARAGMPGVGKTYDNLKQIVKVLYGNEQNGGAAPRKVLIVDMNQEYRMDNEDVRQILTPYRVHIKTINPRQVINFSKSRFIQCCRIVPINNNGQIMSISEFGETLNTILNNFHDGLLIAEDFKVYTGNSLNKELIGKLATRRHAGCDTLVSVQGMNMIQPTLWTVMDWVYLHRTVDPISRGDIKFKSQVHFLSIAEKIVNTKYQAGDIRFYLKINIKTGGMFGNYTPDEFKQAALEYIYENWSSTSGRLLKHLDLDTGNAKYDKKSATNKQLQEYMNDFSQYSPRFKK